MKLDLCVPWNYYVIWKDTMPWLNLCTAWWSTPFTFLLCFLTCSKVWVSSLNSTVQYVSAVSRKPRGSSSASLIRRSEGKLGEWSRVSNWNAYFSTAVNVARALSARSPGRKCPAESGLVSDPVRCMSQKGSDFHASVSPQSQHPPPLDVPVQYTNT